MPYEHWHFRLGLQGLAILRTGVTVTDEQRAEQVAAIATAPDLTDPVLTKVIGGTERDVEVGYAHWAPVYDKPGNPLIAQEQPVVHGMLAQWPAPLRVLDAPCGTGRHTAHLAALGHDVTGVDASPGMLGLAAEKCAGLPLVEGNIESLPFPSGSFDAAVCALLFDHLPNIDRAVGELARVVRPGGRVLISNIHPTMSLTGAHASFSDAHGDPNFIRSHHHAVSTYLATFRAHGLSVVGCAEPCWDTDSAQAKFPFVSHEVARDALAGLPMALIWELER